MLVLGYAVNGSRTAPKPTRLFGRFESQLMTVIAKHSRMPRKYEPAQEQSEPAKLDESMLPALKGANPQEILTRYLSDESTKDIAASYGVTRQALGKHLLKHAEEDWKEAQVARAIARKEAAEDSLESARDPLQLAKARELFKAATWDLERVCRRIYGEDKAAVPTVTPILNIVIASGTQEPARIQVSLAHAQDQLENAVEGQVIDVQPQ
jgi:hypothetical protein